MPPDTEIPPERAVYHTMKSNLSPFLLTLLGCQPAGADLPAALRGNVRELFTDSVFEHIELPAAWSVDVPEPGEEGFISTCCVLTAASGIRLVFGHGGEDAPYWSMGLLFDAGQSVAWLFVSERIDYDAVAALEQVILRVDAGIHSGYNTADALAAALRVAGEAV